MLFRHLFIALLFTGSFTWLKANDWPAWRGPSGNGKLDSKLEYPTRWSAGQGILWRIALPSPGNSSPIVFGKKLFLTSAENKGKDRSLLCFNTGDGSLLWKKTVSTKADQITHKTNPYSSASPFCDGERVYAWHGNAGLHVYDLSGKEVWSRDLGSDYDHIWGPNAASPVVHEELLLIHAGPGVSVTLFGLDRKTGDIKWKNDLNGAESKAAKEFKGSWATPFLLKTESSFQILLGLPGKIQSFDPANGKEIWQCRGLSDLSYTNVLTGNGRAVYFCGYGGPGLGMRLPEADESGDLTDTYRLWADPLKGKAKKRNPQRIGSGQIIGDYLYVLNEPGSVECIEVETGATKWKEKLSGKSWSSMNLINGLLYVNDKQANSYVLKPDSTKLSLIAQNKLDSKQLTNSSMAFASGQIYFRTHQYLYAIGR